MKYTIIYLLDSTKKEEMPVNNLATMEGSNICKADNSFMVYMMLFTSKTAISKAKKKKKQKTSPVLNMRTYKF